MKKLTIDKLLRFSKREFSKIADKRSSNKSYELGDILQCGLAIFHLKCPSLLEFVRMYPEREKSMLQIYKVANCPKDTQMREILDEVEPSELHKIRRKVLMKLNNGGWLKDYRYLRNRLVVSIDGVHHHSSKDIHCDKCQQSHHRDGTVTYKHSMLSAVIVHPDKKVVLPLRDEPIVLQDGKSKNDSELCAVCRLLDGLERDHPKLKFIIVEDALYANGPHIKRLREKKHDFIIRAKRGSAAGYVFTQYNALLKKGKVNVEESNDGKVWKVWHYVNDLPLNGANPDVLVNFLHYEERDPRTGRVLKSFDWISSIRLSKYTIKKVTKAGRARWKIENETFNTLKNQGYNYGHNFGHGHKNLCTVFALLMMMAFLFDQIQQLCCPLFNKAWQKKKAKRRLWDAIRVCFKSLPFRSMEQIYKAIIYGYTVKGIVIKEDSR